MGEREAGAQGGGLGRGGPGVSSTLKKKKTIISNSQRVWCQSNSGYRPTACRKGSFSLENKGGEGNAGSWARALSALLRSRLG